jgi:predicted RNase H-like HicB family nuclease
MLRGGRLKNFQVHSKRMLRYRVIIEKDEDGVLVARVPDLPGCATEGRTRQELMKNVREAIQAYLEALKESGEPVPVEMVQVSV